VGGGRGGLRALAHAPAAAAAAPLAAAAMGLLSIIKKVKAKEKEMRILMVYAPRARTPAVQHALPFRGHASPILRASARVHAP
jgi:hypothetical protein